MLGGEEEISMCSVTFLTSSLIPTAVVSSEYPFESKWFIIIIIIIVLLLTL